MIKEFIGSVIQNLYGATQPYLMMSPQPVMYGPGPMPPEPPIEKISIFLPFLFCILIPVILLTGVFAFAKMKRLSNEKRMGIAILVLSIYLIVLLSAVVIIYVLGLTPIYS